MLLKMLISSRSNLINRNTVLIYNNSSSFQFSSLIQILVLIGDTTVLVSVKPKL